MKVIVNRSVLANALILANATIAARSPKPILQCVLLVAEGGKLSIFATDLETSIHQTLGQVQIESEGRTLAPADRFMEIIRETTDDTVTLVTDDECIRVVSSDANFKMFKPSDADFPSEPKSEGKKFSLSLADAQTLLGRTACAMARVETKYAALNGTLFKAKGKAFEVVASDGRRLAHTSCDLLEDCGKTGWSAIVPPKALSLIGKLDADKGDEPTVLTVTIADNRIVFECDDIRIGSSIIEGEFPPYDAVIPKDANKKLVVDRVSFLGAVRRAGLFTNEEKMAVKFDCSKKGVKLSSTDPSAGEGDVNFPCKFEGEDLQIGFNPKFLLDGLKACDDAEIVFEMTEPSRPGIIRADRFLYVISPVNMNPTCDRV